MPIIPEIPIIPPKGMDGSEFFRRVGQVRGGIGELGRKRRSSKEKREGF
ncbi:hypothetical protein HMPREF9072_02286 [Capnocytophaga sp. oral taxon 324 str. F0483]|nr:hypothetical protein HMPREF9072_02286 [Capnocytophaga sp. oral taxon 324 str. F0483]